MSQHSPFYELLKSLFHPCLEPINAKLDHIVSLLNVQRKAIMSTSAELAQGIADLTTQVGKIGTETTTLIGKVGDLETALANAANVDPAVLAAFDALKAQVQTVDDLVPDAPAPAPAPAPADAPAADTPVADDPNAVAP